MHEIAFFTKKQETGEADQIAAADFLQKLVVEKSTLSVNGFWE
jgi:hypothetical protein